jgi:hypothetical protein
MSKRLLVRDPRGERERLLVGTMTVGRDTRCDISDADPLLSRRHAEFVCRPDSLVVRDLNSRNGVAVNGVKVQEAVLRPGDVVKVAKLIMTYLGDIDPARSASTSAAGLSPRLSAARTENIERAGGRGPSAAGLDPQDERTRVVPRLGAPHTTPPGQVAVASMTPSAPEPPQVDSDSTRPMIRQSEAKTATPVLPLSALAAAEGAPAPTAATPLEDWSLELRPPQVDRPSPHAGAPPAWLDGPVLRGSLSLAIVAFALAAAPALIWHGRIVESAATAQALAVVRAFAAEAGSALQSRGAAGLGPVAERARATDGVVSAVVMWADGRVAASASLAARRVTLIPGLRLPPDAVQSAASGSRDGLIDAAAPVRTSDGSRAAVVWVTVRPAASLTIGMVVVVLGPSLLAALVAATLFAWWLRRPTTGGRAAVG